MNVLIWWRINYSICWKKGLKKTLWLTVNARHLKEKNYFLNLVDKKYNKIKNCLKFTNDIWKIRMNYSIWWRKNIIKNLEIILKVYKKNISKLRIHYHSIKKNTHTHAQTHKIQKVNQMYLKMRIIQSCKERKAKKKKRIFFLNAKNLLKAFEKLE